MMMSFKEIKESAKPFLDYLFNALKGVKCDVSVFELDHICYRVASVQEYVKVKKLLKNEGVLVADNLVNGREISVFKLFNPIIYKGREIFLFELPSPKAKTDYGSGFEHVEFVVVENLRSYMQDNPHLNFNIKGIDKAVNPEIRLKFEHGVVKFHGASLLHIIEAEKLS